jgi:acetyltransferase-like isoleucine patch superfamily enzyme
MTKAVPGFVKTLYRNIRMRTRYSRGNRLGRRIRFSRDTVMGSGCVIGNDVVFGTGVRLGNTVTIGAGAVIERMEVGDNSVVEGRVIITGHGEGRIKIGRESFIGHNTILDFSDDITIGDFVHVGYNQFWTHSSAMQALNGIPLSDKDKRFRPTSPVVIENNVYVGVHSTIYPGVTIRHHSIIAPNSAVTKDVDSYTMAGGAPARFIKSLKD